MNDVVPPRRAFEVVRLAALLVLAVVLEAVLTSHVRVLGVTVDVFIMFAVLVGASRGPVTGMLFGFACGLTADVVFLQPIGLGAFTCLLAGYLTGRYVERMLPRSAWTVMMLVGCATFGGQSIFGLFEFMTGSSAPFITMVWRQMLPAAVLTGLVAAPVQVLLVRARLMPDLGAGVSSRGAG